MNYTPRQVKILRMISDYREVHGFSPTYFELAKQLDVSAITVFEHIEALERKGAVRRRRHEARSVEIIDPDFTKDGGGRKGILNKGILSKGRWIEGDGRSDPAAEIFGTGAMFFSVRIQGNQYVDEHILDGDLLVFEIKENPMEGDVVMMQGEEGVVSLRRYSRDNGRRTSSQASSKYAHLLNRSQIRGVLRGLVRRFR
jgi:SOS-response transcriptional repressor LexA